MGESGPLNPKRALSIEQMARDAIELIEFVFPKQRVNVLGLSYALLLLLSSLTPASSNRSGLLFVCVCVCRMGGLIAQQLTLLQPALVHRLVLVCTWFGGRYYTTTADRQALVEASRALAAHESERPAKAAPGSVAYEQWMATYVQLSRALGELSYSPLWIGTIPSPSPHSYHLSLFHTH
jgi:pimeloyl-ACP methyl ester carboxylesterase